MKKGLRYIVLILTGASVAYFTFINRNNLFQKTQSLKENYMVVYNELEQRKLAFAKSAPDLLGESIIINGTVKEVYKNSYNEMVLYVTDKNIPISINCTLSNLNRPVNKPFKLGETINLQGIFTQLNDQMHLEGCRLISREQIN